MARTQLQTDWTDTRSAPRGNEWDSLRSELAALLDQVEDRFQLHGAEPVAHAATGTETARPSRPPEGRHVEALKSVRKAVNRLSEREGASGEREPLPPASDERKSDIAKAISQIRARQGAQPVGAATPAASPAPAPAANPSPDDARALIKAIGDLGARFERLESQVESRIGARDPSEDVADQIAQLSEVVELLAGAVGQNSHTQKLEAQIARLAESVAFDRPAEHDTDAVAERLEALAATIEKLTEHQIQSSGREAEASAAAIERSEGSLRHVEESVRAIYDRIDAMEAARGASTPEIESLSREIAGITAALSERDEGRDSAVLERIDALHARIESLDSASSDPSGLDASIERLRAAVTETMDPRFSAIEARLETLDRAPQAPSEPDPAIAGIHDQLKHLSQRIEETGLQLESLTKLAQTESEQAEAPDLDRLADMVAARTRSELHNAAEGGLAASDLDKLEERLSALFSGSGQDDGGSLAGVRDSIANVDCRLARLEATLNGTAPVEQPSSDAQGSAATAALAAKPAVTPRRQPQPDTMPQPPGEGETLEIGRRRDRPRAPEPDFSTLRSETEPARPVQAQAAAPTDTSSEPQPFALDPETVERPAKPVSSLAEDASPNTHPDPVPTSRAEKPHGPAGTDAETAASPAATRATFIEAARRAARQQEAQEAPEEPKSLIGRALARFQRSEAEETASTHSDSDAPRAEAIPTAPQVEAEPHAEEDPDTRSSFLKRHRRPLLLSAALVVVVLLSANLVSQRMASADGDSATTPVAPQDTITAPAGGAAASDEQAPQSAAPAQTPSSQSTPPTITTPVAPEPAATAPEVLSVPQNAGLTSPVSVERQNSGFSGGVANGPLAYGDTTDPLTTASVGNPADASAPAAVADVVAAEPTLSATLPAFTVPEAIEPADLREAANDGDKEALFEVAAILTEGHAVAQNLEGAAALYERAAVKGYAPAQYRLGNLYETGGGVEKDLEMARQWYERAAEAGNRMAMHNLASLYAGGELETQDFAQAARWFEAAATRGMTDSQFNLGMLYARGLGVEQSFAQSYVWFSLAANAGDEDAGQARDDVSRSLDPETVQALDDRVAAWTPEQIAMEANFAPIGTWAEDFDPGKPIANNEVVLRVQQLLDKLGYDVGQADGLMGPQTRSAISSFERETGMSESGEVNPRLLAVLGSQPV